MDLESGGKGGVFGEGEGPCNLSKSCFLGGFFWCREGVRSGVALAPAGSTWVSGEMPAPRVGARELLQSHVFTLHNV